MKANELMIGDWVRNDLGEYQTVVELRESGAMLAYNDIYPYDAIEPIPITPEILEKNFGSALNGCYFEGDEFYELMIHEVNDGTWIIKHDNIEFSNIPRQQVMVSYVHELQHALRICGIEKEIDLC